MQKDNTKEAKQEIKQEAIKEDFELKVEESYIIEGKAIAGLLNIVNTMPYSEKQRIEQIMAVLGSGLKRLDVKHGEVPSKPNKPSIK